MVHTQCSRIGVAWVGGTFFACACSARWWLACAISQSMSSNLHAPCTHARGTCFGYTLEWRCKWTATGDDGDKKNLQALQTVGHTVSGLL